ncbi:MFS transporter [Niveispirillum sp.]|uniref:MFS transporter n=1 Tax=Niveispirillum sp. TaxID=1917217 RepID=UPI001B7B8300|nr:MFS transporter [Niveispirillum sp.]MBP7335198.1 MFS transporter [Niveispirillum sp.]
MSPAQTRFRGREIGLYAAGSLGTGIFSTVPSVLLLYFCTQILAIPPGVAALLVFVPKALALFWDPFVGGWSDGTNSRWGRRRPFLLLGALGTALAFIGLFSPPDLPQGGVIAWVGGAYLLLVAFYAFFAVPYVALPAEFAPRADERARLVGWRMAVVMIGVLAGAGLAPVLVAHLGGGRQGYAGMALWIGGACALFMLCPLLFLRGRDRPDQGKRARTGPLLPPFRQVWRDRPFRRLLAAYILMLTAASLPSAATPYFITGPLERGEGDIGTALGLMLAAGSLAAPLLARAGRRWGDGPVLRASILTYLVASTLIAGGVWLSAGWPLILAGFALAGPAFAGQQVLPYTMISHLIHDRARQGAAEEGALMGLWTAAEKLGLALAPLVTGLLLSLAGGEIAGRLAPLILAATFLFGALSLFLLRPGADDASPAQTGTIPR